MWKNIEKMNGQRNENKPQTGRSQKGIRNQKKIIIKIRQNAKNVVIFAIGENENR